MSMRGATSISEDERKSFTLTLSLSPINELILLLRRWMEVVSLYSRPSVLVMVGMRSTMSPWMITRPM